MRMFHVVNGEEGSSWLSDGLGDELFVQLASEKGSTSSIVRK